MHQLSDTDVVRRCLEGDADIFALLVQRYQAAVYATAFYYVGRYGAAEDIAQESFWAAYRGLSRLRDPERFGAWLKEITTRTAANWLRKNAPRLQNETPLPARRTVPLEDAQAGPEGAVEHRENYERVQAAIDALPERYRLPVMLRYLQELNYDEISRFTGDSKEEIRGIMYRAGKLLRESLAEGESDEGASQWRRARK